MSRRMRIKKRVDINAANNLEFVDRVVRKLRIYDKMFPNNFLIETAKYFRILRRPE